jgi:hypothetical protein
MVASVEPISRNGRLSVELQIAQIQFQVEIKALSVTGQSISNSTNHGKGDLNAYHFKASYVLCVNRKQGRLPHTDLSCMFSETCPQLMELRACKSKQHSKLVQFIVLRQYNGRVECRLLGGNAIIQKVSVKSFPSWIIPGAHAQTHDRHSLCTTMLATSFHTWLLKIDIYSGWNRPDLLWTCSTTETIAKMTYFVDGGVTLRQRTALNPTWFFVFSKEVGTRMMVSLH